MNTLRFLSSLPDASGKSLLRKLGFGYMLSPMVAYTSRIIMQAITARVIRTCRLRFQGSPKVFAPVAVGTPQGSPVSLLLFVIYISQLHHEIPQGRTLSYVDYFGLTVSSASYRRNIQLLQRHYAVLKAKGAQLGVSLFVPKTELIHWRTPRDRGPISRSPIHLEGSTFLPKRRAALARLLVHALALDHPTLDQETGQGTSSLCGGQKALPPGDRPTPFSVPPVGIIAPVPHPQLRRGYLQAHRPHDAEAFGLLAQSPEMDHQLLRVHTHRHPGCRSLPSPS